MKKHGLTGKRIFGVWRAMIQRCYDKNSINYDRYGGRGIYVCSEWLEDPVAFANFAEQNGYDDHKVIDRIDNSDGYHPRNVRFVDIYTNANNKRNNVRWTAFGERKTIRQWTKDPRCVVSFTLLTSRLYQGWDAESAITTPKMQASKSRQTITPQKAASIKRDLERGIKGRTIAKKYGVSPAAVTGIKKGRAWQNV